MRIRNVDFLIPIIYYFYRAFTLCLRYSETGREVIDKYDSEKRSLVFCLWHDELFPLMKVQRQLDIVTVVSPSHDGGLLAGVLERLGLRTVRGSSTRKGMSALLNAVKVMKKDSIHACVTIDGPLGPRHIPKEGAFFLAYHANALIVPVRMKMRTSFKFKTWDKFQIPYPFSRVDIEYGEPYEINSDKLTSEILEEEKEKLSAKLKNLEKDNYVSKNISNCNHSPFSIFENIQYFLLKQLGRFISFLGFNFVRRLGQIFGFLVWHLVPKRRRLATSNIKQALDISQAQARQIARASFDHTGRSFIEIAVVPIFNFEPKKTKLYIAEPERLEAMMTSTRPMVAATGHMGAWELLAGLTGEIYKGKPRIIVVRQYPNRAVQQFITDSRESHGAQMVSHKYLAQHVIRTLKQNGLAAFLIDHHAQAHEAVKIPFFGREANVNVGPAILALRAEALIFPIFIVRDGAEKNSYILHLQEPLDTREVQGETREEKVKEIATFYTKAMEKIIKQYPEQWFWMHNRWKP